MNDLYNGKWLRRWSLSVSGQAECVEDAVDVGLLSAEDREAIETKNTAIHEAIEKVLSYNAAILVQEPGEDVTRTMRVYEPSTLDPETGEEVLHWHMDPRPEWQAWDDAQVLISEMTPELLALQRIRVGEPLEGDSALVDEIWNYPIEVTVRVALPDLWPADFKSILNLSGYAEPLLAWIYSIENPVQREFAKSKLLYSAMYSRYDPLVVAAQPAIGISDIELDSLWLWGSSGG